MKKSVLSISIIILLYSIPLFSQPARMLPEVTPSGKGKVNTMVDNIG